MINPTQSAWLMRARIPMDRSKYSGFPLAHPLRQVLNASRFFITTEKTTWLDKKHTIFGRAVQGLDVVHKIENVRVGKKSEKPEEDIKILNIEVS